MTLGPHFALSETHFPCLQSGLNYTHLIGCHAGLNEVMERKGLTQIQHRVRAPSIEIVIVIIIEKGELCHQPALLK